MRGDFCVTTSSSKNQTCVVVWKTNNVQRIKGKTDLRSHSVNLLGFFFCLMVAAISNGGSQPTITMNSKRWLVFSDSHPLLVTWSLPLYLLVLPHGGRLSLWHTFNGIHQFFHEKPEKIS